LQQFPSVIVRQCRRYLLQPDLHSDRCVAALAAIALLDSQVHSASELLQLYLTARRVYLVRVLGNVRSVIETAVSASAAAAGGDNRVDLASLVAHACALYARAWRSSVLHAALLFDASPMNLSHADGASKRTLDVITVINDTVREHGLAPAHPGLPNGNGTVSMLAGSAFVKAVSAVGPSSTASSSGGARPPVVGASKFSVLSADSLRAACADWLAKIGADAGAAP